MFGLDQDQGSQSQFSNRLSDVVPGDIPRQEKSLLNTFPFNIDQHHGQQHHHSHHHQEHQHQQHPQSSQLSSRTNPKTQHNSLFPFKSAEDTDNGSVTVEDFIVEDDTTETNTALEEGSVDFNTIGAASAHDEDVALGRKCIDKVNTSSVYMVHN